jgi:hypothetical protein
VITEALMGWFDTGVSGLIGVFPEVPTDLQSFFTTAPSSVQNYALGLDKWAFLLPWQTFGVSILVAISAIGVGIAIRLARMVISYLTLGGGM